MQKCTRRNCGACTFVLSEHDCLYLISRIQFFNHANRVSDIRSQPTVPPFFSCTNRFPYLKTSIIAISALDMAFTGSARLSCAGRDHPQDALRFRTDKIRSFFHISAAIRFYFVEIMAALFIVLFVNDRSIENTQACNPSRISICNGGWLTTSDGRKHCCFPCGI